MKNSEKELQIVNDRVQKRKLVLDGLEYTLLAWRNRLKMFGQEQR
jgi:hypothetical protein